MQISPKPLIVAFITAMAVVFLLVSTGQGLRAAEAASSPQAVSGVDDYMKNVTRYRGKVSLEGVVSAVSPKQQAVSLIDAKEYQACRVTTCAPLTLPVQWRGPIPAVGTRVRVEGQARKIKGKLMFVADKLEKVSGP
jgi:hypothetical protein